MDTHEKNFRDLMFFCKKIGINPEKFLSDMEKHLEKRTMELLTPNIEWFKEGKEFNRYWIFVEKITGTTWEHNEVVKRYKRLRCPSETRENVSSSLRYEVLNRDKSTCQICGKRAPDVELAVDHKIPWCLGGPTVIDNLQALCVTCNSGKSNKYYEQEDDNV